MLKLDIVTPAGAKVEVEAASVTAPGLVGSLGVLPGHRALLTSLAIGPLSYAAGGETHWLAVNGGYMEVADDRVIIVTETAEAPDEIDRDRAEQALETARERLKEAETAQQAEMVKVHLAAAKRAETRLGLLRHRKTKIPD
jgi:F-type H+-transporting ATPase subunit epsilon